MMAEKIIEQIYAHVGEDVILLSDVQKRTDQIRKVPTYASLSEEEKAKMTFDSLIEDRLIAQEVKRLKIDVKKVHEIMKNASGNSWPISIYNPLPGIIEGVQSNNKYLPDFTA
mgnify:CR=1 FL=1